MNKQLEPGWLKRGLEQAKKEFDEMPQKDKDRIKRSKEFQINVKNNAPIRLMEDGLAFTQAAGVRFSVGVQ